MGLFSLIVTATTYVPALFIGAAFLHFGWLDRWQLQSSGLLHSTIDFLVSPITQMAVHLLPNWLIFVLGLGIILVSFQLFDKCLPQMTLKESQFGWVSRLVYKPWVMFFLGAFVTLISMSVSISLSILVPLSARGFIRRENVTPYIMGANITTFIDTLLAAVLLSNPAAFTVVFVEMVSITLVSALILALLYQGYQRGVLRSVEWITASNRNLAIFMVLIFCLPIILIML
jgi:Na+/phosphate symporter